MAQIFVNRLIGGQITSFSKQVPKSYQSKVKEILENSLTLGVIDADTFQRIINS